MKIVVLAALLPVSAYAWGSGPVAPTPVPAAVMPAAVVPNGPVTSTSSSTAASRAASASRSSSGVTNNVSVNNQSAGGSGGGAGSGGGYGGRAPDVIGVPLVGANNCAVGLTLGGSGPSAGGLFGLLWEGSACARNRDATLLNNLGLRGAGVELLCDSADIRQAMYRNGTPCRKDIEKYGAIWAKEGWRP